MMLPDFKNTDYCVNIILFTINHKLNTNKYTVMRCQIKYTVKNVTNSNIPDLKNSKNVNVKSVR